MSRPKSDLEKRFWSKVNIKGEDECWEWKAGKVPDGYGTFRLNHKSEHAHRIAFVLLGGLLTEEKPFVLHHCDNPACCNSKHLFAGNQQDNIRDMIIKNMAVYVHGEKAGASKLKESDVIKIRNLKGVMTQKEIGKMFNVTRVTISDIHNRNKWRHLCG